MLGRTYAVIEPARQIGLVGIRHEPRVDLGDMPGRPALQMDIAHLPRDQFADELGHALDQRLLEDVGVALVQCRGLLHMTIFVGNQMIEAIRRIGLQPG